MFEIDPITGLPIIDPITGKPKIKQAQFKNQKEAKAYFAQEQANKFDELLGSLGINQTPSSTIAVQRQAQRQAFEQQTGLNPDDYLDTEFRTPGGTSGIDVYKTERDRRAIEQMNLLEEKGMTPMVGSDYEDLLAEQQSVGEQWANGLVKFAGKTAINVGGTLGNMVVGIPYWIADGKFSSFYDNQFMNFMSDLEEDLNSALPNYVRKEVEDYSLLKQMLGTANFWANDVLGGLSFVAGALISEYATAGLATFAQLSKSARVLKYASKADDILGAGKTVEMLSGVDDLGRFARQLGTGTSYEAAIEANHFVKDAKDKFVADFVRIKGREPNEAETALAMQDIYSAGNLVFGANAALVSASNMATLPNTFGPKLFNRLSPKLDDAAGKTLRYSELSPDDVKMLAKKKGVSVQQMMEEVKANPGKLASEYDLYSKPRNVFEYSKNFIKGPGAEMFEELGQSLISDTALEHVASKWDEDGTETVTSLAQSFSQTLADSLGDKEFWKEGIIGLIIGGIGGPNVGRKKGESFMQGGIWELGNKKEKAGVQSLINEINARPDLAGLTKEMAIAAVRNTKAAKQLDQAVSLGDMFRAKNKENEIFYNTAAAWHRVGRIEDFQKDTVESIEKMSNEEFKTLFEYTNMDEAEISERKKEVIEATKERIQEVKDSMREASRVIDSKDRDLHDAYAFSLSTIKGLDRREASIAETLRDKIGILPQSRDLRDLIKAALKVQDTDNIKRYEDITNQLNEARRNEKYKNLKRALTTEESKVLEKNEREIERLEKEQAKELENLLKIVERGEKFKKYDRDIDSFKQDLDLFRSAQKEIYDRVGVEQPEIKEAWEDLKKIAKYREQLITEYNWLVTKEGKKKFYESLDNWEELLKQERLSVETQSAAMALAADEEVTYNRIMDYALRSRKIKAFNPGVEELPLEDDLVPSAEVTEKDIAVQEEIADNIIDNIIENNPELDQSFVISLENISNSWKKALENYKTSKDYSALSEEADSIKTLIETFIKNSDEDTPPAFVQGLNNYLQGINSFLKNEKTRTQATKETKDTSNPGTVVLFPEALGMLYTNFFNDKNNEAELAEAVEYLQSTSIDTIADNLEVELSTYESGGETVGTKNPGVTVTRGWGGKKVQAVFYVKKGGKKIKIGAVPDLRRFKVKGNDFNVYDVTHLKELNSSFVYKNEAGQLVPTLEGTIVQQTRSKIEDLYRLLDEKAEEVSEGKVVNVSNEEIKPLISLSRSANYINNYINKTLADVTNEDLVETEYTDIEEGQAVKKKFKGHVVVFYSTKGKDFYIKREGSNVWEKATDEIEGLAPIVEATKVGSNMKKTSGYYFLQPYKAAKKRNKVEFDTPSTTYMLLSMKYPSAEMSSAVEQEFMNNFKGTVEKAQEIADKLKAEFNDPESSFYKNRKAYEEADKAKDENKKKILNSELNALRGEFYKENEFDSKIPGFFIPVSQIVGAVEYPIGAYLDIKPSLSGEGTQIVFSINDYRDNTGNVVPLKTKKGKDVYIRINIKDTSDEGIVVQSDETGKNFATISSSEEFVNLLNDALKPYLLTDKKGNTAQLPKVTNILKVTDPELGNFDDLKFNKILNPFNISLVDNSEFAPARQEARKVNKTTEKTPTSSLQGKLAVQDKEKKEAKTQRTINLSEEELSEEDKAELEKLKAQQASQPKTDKPEPSAPISTTTDIYDRALSVEAAFNRFEGAKVIDLDVEKYKDEYNSKKVQFEKDFPGKSWKEIIKEKDDNIAFSFESGEEQRSLQEAIDNLKGILPKEVSIKDISEIAHKLRVNGIPTGAVINASMYLSKFRKKGIEFHEAFHIVFRNFLTDNQIKMYLSAAKYKYGKPTQAQINEFKSLVPARELMTEQELYEEWLEEKMADDFMGYMKNPVKPKSLLERLWNKIKELVKFFSKKEATDAINNLFEKISNGRYANAKFVSNKFSTNPSFAFNLLYTKQHKLSPEESVRTINTISRLVFNSLDTLKSKKDYELDTLINKQIKEFIQSYIKGSASYFTSDIQIEKLQNFISILADKENIEKIKKQVKNNLKYYSLPEYSEESSNPTDEIDFEETNENNWDLSISQVGGINSLSKKAKNYLSTVSSSFDPFNILKDNKESLTEEAEILNWGANPVQIHTALTNLLKNSPKKDFLKRIEKSAKYNPLLASFYQKFTSDIATELNITNVSSDTPINILGQSMVYNTIVSAYEKVQAQYAVALMDQSKGLVKVFKSDSNDSARKQVNEWENKFLSGPSRNNKSQNIQNVLRLTEILNTPKKYISSDENLSNTIQEVSDIFSSLGIKVSYGYIRMSLLQNASEVIQSQVEYKRFEDFLSELDLFSEFIGFTVEDAEGLQVSLEKGNNPYTIEKDGTDTAAIGRLIKMANYNATFDETVEETTFRNAENKTIYKIIAANYYFSEINKWSSHRRTELVKSLFFGELAKEGVTDEEKIEAIFNMLVSEDNFATRDEAEGLWLQIKHNSLLKGLKLNSETKDIMESPEYSEDFLNNLVLFILDGMRKVSLVKEGDSLIEEDFKDSDASVFSKSSDRDKLFMTMAMFGKGETLTEGKQSNFLRKFIEKLKGGKILKDSIEVTLYRNEIIEAKKTQTAIQAPVQTLINGNGTLNVLGEERFMNILRTELDQTRRAREVVKKIKSGELSTEGLTKNYYFTTAKLDGKTIEIFGNEFNLQYRIEGNTDLYPVSDDIIEKIYAQNKKKKSIEDLVPKSETLFELNDIKLYNLPLYEALIKDLNAEIFRDSIQDFAQKRFEGFVDYLKTPEIGLIKEITKDKEVRDTDGNKITVKDTKDISAGLPNFFNPSDSLSKSNLMEFYFNDYFTSVEVGQLVHGPMARLYKDAVDGIKRNSRLIASGPSIGNGSTKIIVKPSVEFKDRVDKSESQIANPDNIDTTDAQVFAHPLYRLRKYLPSLGKNDSETTQAMIDIIKGKDLNDKQNKHLQRTKNTSRPLKLVGSGRMFNLKCSVADIERGQVSYLVDDSEAVSVLSKDTLLVARQEQADIRTRKAEKEQDPSKPIKTVSLARAASDYLYDKFINGTITQSELSELHSLWKPIDSKEYLHEQLNEMEQKGALMVAYDSAIKVDNKLGMIEVSDAYIKEQVETSNIKDELVHGTQLMNLIWSEQKDDTIVTVGYKGGKPINVTLKALRNAYKKQLADRNYKGLEKFLGLVTKRVNAETKVINYEVLLELLNDSLDISNPDPYMKEVLRAIQNPESPDLVLPEYNLNLGILVNKVAEMYMSLASKSALKHKVTGAKLTLKSDIGENVMEFEGKIITPEEFKKNPKKYAGKVTTRRLAWRVEKNGEIYTEIKISAKTAAQYKLGVGDNVPKHLLEALGVRIPTQDKHSMVYAKIVEFLPPHTGNIVVMPAEIIKLSGADFDIDSLFARLYATWGKNDNKYGSYKNTQEAFEEWKYSTLNSKEGRKALKKFYESEYSKAANEQAIFEALKNEVTLLKEQDTDDEVFDEIYKEALVKIIENPEESKAILKFMGVPSTQEEFNSKYGKAVSSNITAYESGDLEAVEALTKEEIDTILFDIEKHFVYNQSNSDINSKPATTEPFDELSETHKEAGIEDKTKPTNMHDAVNKSKADSTNSTGKDNIGPAAVFNVMFQRLSEFGTTMRKGNIFGLSKFIGKNADGKILNFDGIRINDLISSIVSAMTDNAKDPKAAEFNLTTDIISPVLVMIGKGLSFDSALTMTKLPAIKKLGQLVISGQRFNADTAVLALKETLKTLEEGDNKLSEESEKSIELNTQAYFLAALQYERGNTQPLTDIFGAEAKAAYNRISEVSISNLLTAKNASNALMSLSSVMALSKGMKPTFADDAVLDNMLKDAGVQMVLTEKGANPYNPRNYKIVHTKQYLADIKGDTFVYDLLPILNGDPAIKSMLQVREVINKLASQIFITKSRDFKALDNLIKANASSWYLLGKDNIKSISDSLLSYISMIGKNSLTKNKKLPLSAMWEGKEIPEFKRKVGVVEQAIRNLQQEFPEFQDNVLLNSLQFSSSEVKAASSPYKGIDIVRISLNTDLKGKHEFSNLLRDASMQLATSSNPQAKEIIRMLVQFSDLKESGQFRNKSLLKALDPKIGLKLQSDALYKAHSLMEELSSIFKTTTTYNNLFNLSKKDFFKESLLKYMLANKNKMAVPLIKTLEVTGNINRVIKGVVKGTALGQELEEFTELYKDENLSDAQKQAIKEFFDDFKVFKYKMGEEGLSEFTVSTYIGATQKFKDNTIKYNMTEKERAVILGTIKKTLEKFGFPIIDGKLGFPAVLNIQYATNQDEAGKPVTATQLFILDKVLNYTGKTNPDTITLDTHDFSESPVITGNTATYIPVSYLGISDFMAAGYSVNELMDDVQKAQQYTVETSEETIEKQDNTVLENKSDNVTTTSNNPSNAKRKTYSGDINQLSPNQIFVFGSNEGSSKGGSPTHGSGSAKLARDKFGAIQGQSKGLQGQSYAIVTKKHWDVEKSSTPNEIINEIKKLYTFANQNPNKEFLISDYSGKNRNGYTGQEMADMFSSAGIIPNNIVFNENFHKLIKYQTPVESKSSKPTINADKKLDLITKFMYDIYEMDMFDHKTVKTLNPTDRGIYYIYSKEVEDAEVILTITALSENGFQDITADDYVTDAKVSPINFENLISQGRLKMLPLTANQAAELKQKLCS